MKFAFCVISLLNGFGLNIIRIIKSVREITINLRITKIIYSYFLGKFGYDSILMDKHCYPHKALLRYIFTIASFIGIFLLIISCENNKESEKKAIHSDELKIGGIYLIELSDEIKINNENYKYGIIKILDISSNGVIWRQFNNVLKEPVPSLEYNLDYSGSSIPQLGQISIGAASGITPFNTFLDEGPGYNKVLFFLQNSALSNYDKNEIDE